MCMVISFSISSWHTEIITTPSQSLTNLFEVLTIKSEMKTTTKAVITPSENLLTLWGPMTPPMKPPMILPNPLLLCNCDTIWSPHHLRLAPWQIGIIALITPEKMLAQGLQKGYWGPQRVWECMSWSRVCIKCGIVDLWGCGRTSEDVEWLQKEC